VGRWGRQVRGPLPLGRDCLGRVLHFVNSFVFCLRKETGFPPVVTAMAVPDSSPRASAVVSVRIPQRLMLADGVFSPLDVVLFRGGALAHPRV
jgi:hypothetical protein